MHSSRKILLRDRLKAFRGGVFLGFLLAVKWSFSATLLRKIYRQLICQLVKKTQLFDEEYYLSANDDVARQKKSALQHYVAYGDKEGRMPLPMFEPVYYRQHSRRKFINVNTLLHYAHVGRYLQYSPGPWFDTGYYLAKNKDVFFSRKDPLLHYLRYGGLEGRAPSSLFNGAHYLQENPDVFGSSVNPLVHYIRFGRFEGRPTHPVVDEPSKDIAGKGEGRFISIPEKPAAHLLNVHADVQVAAVDVVVPVYKGRAETMRCLYSVLQERCTTPFELIVIDDASPDKELVSELAALAGEGYFTFLTNKQNLGFVGTANCGIALHPQRDVVLLNSDTEVYGDWLDRLVSVAQKSSTTGTVTPLSNNATICSYPHFLKDNPYPLEIDYADLDQITADVNAGLEIEAPTGVGFCIYLKRACIDAVGGFDAETFGKGYGEENDFCQRAIADGWKNIIAPDVFVRHLGAASFQGHKEKRVQNALRLLSRLYPNYKKDVEQFIVEDPLAPARKRLDLERLKRFRKSENVLIVAHNRGGGAERHVQEDVERLSKQGKGVFFLRPQQGAPDFVYLHHPAAKILPNYPPFRLADAKAFVGILKTLAISEVHTHGLVDFSPQAPEFLVYAVKELGLYLEINLHDYKVICPRINLIDERGYYCGEESEATCNRCLKTSGSDFGVKSIESWRATHYRALLAADKVLVPDSDVAQRLEKYYANVKYEVSPHENIDFESLETKWPVLGSQEKLKIVVVGAIGKIKGYSILLACAKDAKERKLPLEFCVMGYSMHDQLLQDAGVKISGRYQEHHALQTLSSLEPHIAWLPSVWPETYSYTLSIALLAGLPVVAFDIGAISQRLRRLKMEDLLVPLSYVNQPKNVNDFFLQQLQQFQRRDS